MSQAVLRPGKRTIWIAAARPRTLTAAIAPVLVGTGVAIAEDAFAPLPALAALLGAILLQVGTNLANDYFDAKKGADASRIGPVRVTQAGWVRPSEMKGAIGIVFGLAFCCGIYLVAVAGWPIALLGIASILAGLAYTGGPYPLGYHGLGDLFVLLFFGLAAVVGTHYVQALAFSWNALFLSIPIGLLSVAILVVNNLRDQDSDRSAGKQTLVARYGRGFGRVQYATMLAGAYAAPVTLVAADRLSLFGLLPLLSLPLAVPLLRNVLRSASLEDSLLALAGTSRLLLIYAILTAVGVVAG